MASRIVTPIVTASMLTLQWTPNHAYAENQTGYRLLSVQEASRLPRHHGALGMHVERAQQITDGHDIRFDSSEAGAARLAWHSSRLSQGRPIIAVDGRVFPSITAFGAYVGSIPPGSRIQCVDYIPAGGGPENAKRVPVPIGDAGRPTQEPL